MNQADRDRLEVIRGAIEDLANQIEDLAGDLETRADNIGDYWPESPTMERLINETEALNEAWETLDQAKDHIQDAIEGGGY